MSSELTEDPGDSQAVSPAPEPIRLSVTWGDYRLVPADIHVAGHYQGVIPSSAERALDEVISSGRLVLQEHTRRGWLVGALGQIAYFPGSGPKHEHSTVRQVAIAGMGRPGTFNEFRAEQMYASLLSELIGLDSVRSAATVLIGSGAGNLMPDEASRALVAGFASAARKPSFPGRLERVVVVEMDRLRAELIRRALERSASEQAAVVRVDPEVERVEGGLVGLDYAAVFAIRGLGRLVREQGQHPRGTPQSAEHDPVGLLLGGLAAELRDSVRGRLGEIVDDTAVSFVFGDVQGRGGSPDPAHISVVDDPDGFRWAALTARSTIPERVVAADPQLVERIVARLTNPTTKDASELPLLLTRVLVPAEFQPHITAQAALVVEVDVATARIPWEFLIDEAYDSGENTLPLVARTPIARQLRTTYARAVSEDAESTELRALVIGLPGDPAQGESLPHAGEEAIELAALLGQFGVDVRLFLGRGAPHVENAEPATRVDVLKELLGRNYHLIHYSGHGTFDPEKPRATGWLFPDGLLGARELAQLTRAPRLVVANACWTAARPAEGTNGDDRVHQAQLTPVLADEFLRVGVVHYVGTSWPIPDAAGRLFARTFYETLFRPAETDRRVGEAIRKAREVLFDKRGRDASAVSKEEWSAWAAYQHYGDPNDVLELSPRVDGAEGGTHEPRPDS